MGVVGDAFEFALAAHGQQTDKAGLAYIGHLARVAALVEGDLAQTVALLHDVIEDCAVSKEVLEQQFGTEVAEAVSLLTRRPGEDPATYYAAIAAHPLARSVKLADLADNSHPSRLAALEVTAQTRLIAKYSAAREALGA